MSETIEKSIYEKRAALLKETAEFFNSNNRSVSPEIEYLTPCRYFLEGRAGCAIGRKIEDKDLCREMDNDGDTSILNMKSRKPELYEKLPKFLTELGVDFLAVLQGLHDIKGNWDENGLSDSGKIRYKDIFDGYCKESKSTSAANG